MSALVSPVPVVSAEERKELEAMVRKRTNPQRLVERARIILLSAQGQGLSAVAWRLGVAENTVRLWRARWTQQVDRSAAERLSDEERPGGPARITPEQICRIVALACEKPEAHGVPITHWTQQELANQAMREGIVEVISQRSVGRFLKSRKPAAAPRALLADREAGPAQGGKDPGPLRHLRRGGRARRERRRDGVD
jgi:transposase